MLSRVYTLLHANNPELMGRTRKVLKPPEICRVGSTRIAWVNFKEICDMYGRLLIADRPRWCTPRLGLPFVCGTHLKRRFCQHIREEYA